MLKMRPNYFFGFRISNIQIYNTAKEAQKLAIEKNPKFRTALINLEKLHITLGVTHLPSEEHVKKVSNILTEWSVNNLPEIFSTPIELNFSNIGSFRNSVIYADIKKCSNYERLCNLAEHLNQLLKNGQYSVEDKIFQPHLTLLKLSKDKRLLRYKKEFKEVCAYLIEKELEFGTQKIESIQLLSMTKKDESGYYFCEHEILTP